MGTSQKLSNLDIDPSMTPFKLILNNYEIRRVKKTKYLDMTVDDSLTWEDHIDYITLKINRSEVLVLSGELDNLSLKRLCYYYIKPQ